MKNYKLSMNQLALVIGLLFFLLTAIPLTLAQVVDDNELDFRFTYLISDKSLYEGGEVIEFEAKFMNNSTHNLSVSMIASSPFLGDINSKNIESETVIIPSGENGSIKVLLPTVEETYGRQILRLTAYATSTSDESITGEDQTLFQVAFTENSVSRLPIVGLIIVGALVAGFVIRSTRQELSDL
tara:strand:+ start:304 stop:855 length:552 start_codon:yes stop_codon:yes gene_type:complete